eukprot:364818-Chlamydomonas_euryale.AAC.20
MGMSVATACICWSEQLCTICCRVPQQSRGHAPTCVHAQLSGQRNYIPGLARTHLKGFAINILQHHGQVRGCQESIHKRYDVGMACRR